MARTHRTWQEAQVDHFRRYPDEAALYLEISLEEAAAGVGIGQHLTHRGADLIGVDRGGLISQGDRAEAQGRAGHHKQSSRVAHF